MSFKKQMQITGHAGAIYDCCVSNHFIYSASADKYVVRWNLTDGSQDKFAIKFDHSIYAIELINENFLIAGLSSGGMHVFDLQLNKEIKFYTQHQSAIFAIRYNQQKKQLYVGDAEGNFSIWNGETFELIVYLPLNCGKIRSIAISASGEHFVLGGQDGFWRVFETEYFNEIHSIDAHKNGTTSVLFHPTNSALLISGGKDALLKVWNWKTESLLQKIVAHTFAIYDLVSVSNGKNIISASRDKHVKVWEVNEDVLEIKQRLDFKSGGHRHSVNALAKISEESFVSCSDDKKIVVWGR